MVNFPRLFLVLAILGTPPTTAHMQMTYPPPLKSKENPHTNPNSVDYNMASPLKPDGSDFPCKGYLSLLGTADGAPVTSWSAGGTYNFTVSGGAAHGGGSCQAALSVDGGRTFRVVHSYEGGCPQQGQSSLGFAVPGDTPAAGEAVFAWTWFNNLGNREMYMNCAVVGIVRGGGGGKGETAFASRPGLFMANIGNGCRTVDSADVAFPDPGPDVDSQGGAAPPLGSCGVGPVVAGGGGDAGSGPGSGVSGGDGGSSGEHHASSTRTSSVYPLTSSGSPKAEPHPTPTPVTDDPGKGWTPGNDWPDWFRSDAPRTTGCSYLAVYIWVLYYTYCLLCDFF